MAAAGTTSGTVSNLTDIEELWVERVVEFSSQYNTTTWSANSVIGPPRVYPRYGDIHGAWAQGSTSASEFIVVEFAEKLYIEAVEIYETLNAGAVVRVSASHPESQDYVTLWEARDLTPQHLQSSRRFSPPLVELDFPICRLKLELNCTAAESWCEIDAVMMKGRRMLRPKEPALTELSRDLRTLVNSELFSDVTFDVQGHHVHAHRAILISRSDYFNAMFCGGLKEATNSHAQELVQLEELSYRGFLAMLQYIYTNDFDDSVSPLDMVELMRIGDQFSLEGMKTLSFCRLCAAIDVDNVVSIYRDAAENIPSLDDVIQLCLGFIARNLDRVTKVTSFCQLPQHVMLHIIQEATAQLSISK